MGMDDLYISSKIAKLANAMYQKVMVYRVTRGGKEKGELETISHTVKAAILNGDDVCKDLLCISVYDTKLIYFFTLACEEFEWIKSKELSTNLLEGKNLKCHSTDFY